MPEHPLKIFEDIDPKLRQMVKDNRNFSLDQDGALPRKTKFLIAMVLDASHGLSDGVLSTAKAAMNAGATKEEITEAFRVAQYSCGVGVLFTAAKALNELFK